MPTSTTATSIAIPATDTLVDVPKRAFAFINTLGTQPSIRAIMEKNGYTQDDHIEGWKLLSKAAGTDFSLVHIDVAASAQAIRDLDEADEVVFHRAHAAIVRRFPMQTEFLFRDLAPTQGPAAALGFIKFLDRLDVVEKGRTGTEDGDKQAIAQLAKRGIDATERARLRKLIELAQTAPPLPVQPADAAQADADHVGNLGALYAWYAEWVEVARAVIERRGDLIQLGIAKRRKNEEDAVGTSPAISESTGSPA